MIPEKTIQFVELAQRTLANYDHIYSSREGGKPVFEVTQLLTSLLAIFVWPKEEYFSWDSNQKKTIITWSELKNNLDKRNFPVTEVKDQYLKKLTNYSDLICYFRNAFAHGNFTFIPTTNKKNMQESTGSIETVLLWNLRDYRDHNAKIIECDWRCTISIGSLTQIARDFTHDLNRSTLEKFESIHGDTSVFGCSKCSFIWISEKERRPAKCISCKSEAQWNKLPNRLKFN